jgi:phosphatidylinositol alpha-1,6-mannosyltransferase
LTIVPYVPDDELPHIYAAADTFAMTSRPGPKGEVEGFGIVYLEAAASGLACIAGSLGGCPDAVAHGVTGWCVDPTDPEAVALALKSILNDVQATTRMGELGRARVLSSFTTADLRSRIVGILETCVAPRSQGVGAP